MKTAAIANRYSNVSTPVILPRLTPLSPRGPVSEQSGTLRIPGQGIAHDRSFPPRAIWACGRHFFPAAGAVNCPHFIPGPGVGVRYRKPARQPVAKARRRLIGESLKQSPST